MSKKYSSSTGFVGCKPSCHYCRCQQVEYRHHVLASEGRPGVLRGSFRKGDFLLRFLMYPISLGEILCHRNTGRVCADNFGGRWSQENRLPVRNQHPLYCWSRPGLQWGGYNSNLNLFVFNNLCKVSKSKSIRIVSLIIGFLGAGERSSGHVGCP